MRIGVIGQRILDDPERVMAAVDAALMNLRASAPGKRWRVISALGEGAERLVVWRALLLDPDIELVAPLPLPVEEYVKDFASLSSKADFINLLERTDKIVDLPPAEGREQAFRAAGQYIVENCNVLLAVWDGAEKHSGYCIAEIIEMAREKGRPVTLISKEAPVSNPGA